MRSITEAAQWRFEANSTFRIGGRILTPDWLPCTSSQGKLMIDNGLMQSNKTLLATAKNQVEGFS